MINIPQLMHNKVYKEGEQLQWMVLKTKTISFQILLNVYQFSY